MAVVVKKCSKCGRPVSVKSMDEVAVCQACSQVVGQLKRPKNEVRK